MYILSPIRALPLNFQRVFPTSRVYQPATTSKSDTQEYRHSFQRGHWTTPTILPLIKPTYQLQDNVHGIRVDLWKYIGYTGHKKGTRSREHHTLDLAASAVPRYGIFNISTENSPLMHRPHRYSLLSFETHISSSTSSYLSNKPY